MRPIFFLILTQFLISCGSNSGNNNSTQTGAINFTGTWSLSNLKHTATGGINSDCTADDFTIIQDAAKFSISTRTFKCESFGYGDGGLQLTIQGGKLMAGTISAGEIGPNYVHIRVDFTSSTGSKSHYIINIDPSGDDYTYSEDFSYSENSDSVFAGTLKRK